MWLHTCFRTRISAWCYSATQRECVPWPLFPSKTIRVEHWVRMYGQILRTPWVHSSCAWPLWAVASARPCSAPSNPATPSPLRRCGMTLRSPDSPWTAELALPTARRGCYPSRSVCAKRPHRCATIPDWWRGFSPRALPGCLTVRRYSTPSSPTCRLTLRAIVTWSHTCGMHPNLFWR